MNRHRIELICTGSPRELIQPDITESEKCHFRLIGLYPVAAGIINLGFGGAVVGIIEITVLIQHLPVGNFHLFPGLCVYRKLYVACYLLAEIHHDLSIRRGKAARCLHIFMLCYFFALLGDQIAGCPLKKHHRLII